MSKQCVRIVEQPAKNYRFRYESEGRSGCVFGVKATPQAASYPKIEIGNYTGEAVILISCVTTYKPYKQHPHKLSSKTHEESYGVYIVRKTIQQTRVIEFKDLGITCVKKTAADIKSSLEQRKSKNIDPTNGGFNFDEKYKFDLTQVRLCFQVLIRKQTHHPANASDWVSLSVLLTDTIKDTKSNISLNIIEITPKQSSVLGNERIAIQCNKVKQEDVQIVFSERNAANNVIWSARIACIHPRVRVHHQYSITFDAPAYVYADIQDQREVSVQLYRPSDQTYSKPVPFKYQPIESFGQSVPPLHKRQRRESENDFNTCSQISRRPFVANIADENVWGEIKRPFDVVSFNNLASGERQILGPYQERACMQYNLSAPFLTYNRREIEAQIVPAFQIHRTNLFSAVLPKHLHPFVYDYNIAPQMHGIQYSDNERELPEKDLNDLTHSVLKNYVDPIKSDSPGLNNENILSEVTDSMNSILAN